ncbi:hypothetical protein HD806DRAFT_545038 [Xylariaceae sp. AK1471]|nr:hypothetical protein HD806DRAFT_545038 [Xylariaceae sp. AK1471]
MEERIRMVPHAWMPMLPRLLTLQEVDPHPPLPLSAANRTSRLSHHTSGDEANGTSESDNANDSDSIDGINGIDGIDVLEEGDIDYDSDQDSNVNMWSGSEDEALLPGPIFNTLRSAKYLPDCRWQGCLYEACIVSMNTSSADPNEYTANGDTPLVQACLNIEKDMVRVLMDYGVDIHKHQSRTRPRSCLENAVHLQPNKVQSLMKLGVNTENHSRSTFGALHIVIYRELEEIVWTMVTHKNCGSLTEEALASDLLNSKKLDSNGNFTLHGMDHEFSFTPLQLWAEFRHIEAIELPFDNDANIHKTFQASQAPRDTNFRLLDTTHWSGLLNILPPYTAKAMLKHGLLNLESEYPEDKLMLHYARAACRRQSPGMLNVSLESSLDSRVCDSNGNWLLSMVCTSTVAL